MGEAAGAEAYGHALAELPITVLAYALTDRDAPRIDARIEAAADKLGPEREIPDSLSPLQRANTRLPVRRVTDGVKRMGYATIWPDADGVLRRAHLVAIGDGRARASIHLATAEMLTAEEASFAADGVRIGKNTQPLNEDASFLVRYRGPVNATYPRYAASDLLSWAVTYEETGQVPQAARDALAGKVIVFGINIAGIEDVVTTPIGELMHGPAFVATAVDNLLHGDGRVAASPDANAALILIASLLAALLMSISRRRWTVHAAAPLLLMALIAFVYLRFDAGTAYELFSPAMAIVLTWLGVISARFLTEGRYNRWLEGTFGRYLAPSIIEELKRNPGRLDLGGHQREITVLFSDVAGFTSLSEKLTPPQVSELLNKYLTPHCAAVMEEGGVVDKFEGDAVMAFFGDPLPMQDHALRACRTALAVQRSLPGLEPVWRGIGLTHFSVRIGLNTGSANVGNFGSAQRFDLHVHGRHREPRQPARRREQGLRLVHHDRSRDLRRRARTDPRPAAMRTPCRREGHARAGVRARRSGRGRRRGDAAPDRHLRASTGTCTGRRGARRAQADPGTAGRGRRLGGRRVVRRRADLSRGRGRRSLVGRALVDEQVAGRVRASSPHDLAYRDAAQRAQRRP